MKANQIAILSLCVLIFTSFGIGIKLDGKITTGLGNKEESEEVDTNNDKDDGTAGADQSNSKPGTAHVPGTAQTPETAQAGEAAKAREEANDGTAKGDGTAQAIAEAEAKPAIAKADVQKLEEAARGLLNKEERTDDENYTMLENAYSALTHYKSIDQALSLQKTHVLLARIHLALDAPEIALLHSREALKVKDANLKPFDMAYGFEVMARSYAALDDKEKAQKYVSFAEKTAEQISDSEKKQQFLDDLDKDPWYGVISR